MTVVRETGRLVTTEQELLVAIRNRIADPTRRIDLRAAGIPPMFERASMEQVQAAEAEFGFALPPLLRRIYIEVGNGGFGPGAGLLGVEGGHTDPDGRHLYQAYRALRELGGPQSVLPLCDLGCGARAAVDLQAPGNHMLTVDVVGITRTSRDLLSWLSAWVLGVDMEADTFELQRRTLLNPFTQAPHPIQSRGRAKGVLLKSWDA